MMDYSLINYGNREAHIQVAKDYALRLERSSNGVIITKEKKNIDTEKEYSLDLAHSLAGRITADEVYAQLANIRHVGFETTDACNLKCTYCAYGEYYNDYDDRTSKQIDSQKAKRLIDFLIEKLNSPANSSPTNEVLISFYGGEPLLNFDFIKEIVHYTQKRQDSHIKFDYTMTTNAIYLKKYIHFLSQYDFRLLVSLDGSKENDAHRKLLNGKSSFDMVYNNLKYIQTNYADYFIKKISFNTVIHNLNNEQDVFSFFQQEFDKVPNFSEVNPTGVKPGLEKAFEDLVQPKPFTREERIYEEMTRILDLDSSQAKRLQNFIFLYSGNVYNNYSDLLVKRENMDHLPTATCLPFSKRIFMTVNNKILPCERIGHQFALGKVTNDEVEIDCEYIAEKYNNYYNSLSGQCERCFHKRSCSQCMFSIKDLEKDPVCDQVANRDMFNDYIQRNMEILYNQPELYKRIMEEIMVVK